MKKKTSHKTSPDVKKLKASVDKLSKELAKSKTEVATVKLTMSKARKEISKLASLVGASLEEMGAIKTDIATFSEFEYVTLAEPMRGSHLYYTDLGGGRFTYRLVLDVHFFPPSTLKTYDPLFTDTEGTLTCDTKRISDPDGRLYYDELEVFRDVEFPTGSESFTFNVLSGYYPDVILGSISFSLYIKGGEIEPEVV